MASEWYLSIGGAQLGPFSSAKLKQLAQEGKIKPSTQLRKGQEGEWVPAGRVKGLFEPTLKKPPPVPQLPVQEVAQPPVAPMRQPVPVTAQPATAIQVNVPQSKVSHSLGIGSVILGFVGLLSACVPFVSIPVLVIGFLLGVAGIVLAATRGGSGIGFSIAGTTTCGILLLPIAIFWYAVGSAVSKTTDDLMSEYRTNETVVPKSDAPSGGEGASPGEQGASLDDGWADAANAVLHGDAKISIVSATVGKVKLKDFVEDDAVSVDDLLQVVVSIENTSTTKKLEYTTWYGTGMFDLEDRAVLSDNFDNQYSRANFGYTTDIQGQVKYESIYPGKSITDTLVFEPPVDTFEYLRLELPAKPIGGQGRIRFRMPRSMVSGME